jgi:hypothetical protein
MECRKIWQYCGIWQYCSRKDACSWLKSSQRDNLPASVLSFAGPPNSSITFFRHIEVCLQYTHHNIMIRDNNLDPRHPEHVNSDYSDRDFSIHCLASSTPSSTFFVSVPFPTLVAPFPPAFPPTTPATAFAQFEAVTSGFFFVTDSAT